MNEKWNQRVGVYGICVTKEGLLVIDKTQGPYRKRYDLPGGGIEPNELLHDALHREVKEETGLEIKVIDQLGTCEFLVPWPTVKFTHLHHIAHLFHIQHLTEKLLPPAEFEGQDSGGATWLSLSQISDNNASPLVIQAKKWLETEKLTSTLSKLDDWIIYEK
ncbi:MAG: ADP-ribose pyrophosphatase YjhB (NUDIX family) [Candidatus Latescibacterota bacterium]|jgi:ADP-ribose pyrophosphatase YjhB (NUDIX family)